MDRITFHDSLGMVERLLKNTNPVLESNDYHVLDGDHEFTLELPVAGFSQDDISVEVEGSYLIIEGSGNDSHWASDFTRRFKLPVSSDDSSIDAKITNGVLVITVPKKKESKSRKVKIS